MGLKEGKFPKKETCIFGIIFLILLILLLWKSWGKGGCNSWECLTALRDKCKTWSTMRTNYDNCSEFCEIQFNNSICIMRDERIQYYLDLNRKFDYDTTTMGDCGSPFASSTVNYSVSYTCTCCSS